MHFPFEDIDDYDFIKQNSYDIVSMSCPETTVGINDLK